ncbi:MAG: tol-pal system protein YbgF [Piscirickettsiaceae bacterium]|nr:MAG: tol-pal system protein YbgF [Piscirickettsiaceae bacterium]
MRKLVNTGQIIALLVISGAASAALPPVVNGSGQIISEQRAQPATVGMFNRLQQLQQEMQQLRGQVEEQAYIIDTLKKRQRDLYLDTDRRIQRLEGRSSIASPSNLAGSAQAVETDVERVTKTNLATGDADRLAYEKAFSSLKSGRYKQAIVEFSEFSKLFTTSSYLPNALYWLGEASYVNRDFDKANAAFNKVLSQFSEHSKAKDALLKIGFIQYENKQWKAARNSLITVSKKYHGSTAARLAEQRLDRMRQEKR